MEKANIKSLLVSSDFTLKQAMQKLSDTAEKILFVVDSDNKLLGTLTDGDIRRGIIGGLKFNDKIGRIMHRDCIKVKVGTPEMARYIKKIMLKDKIEQIPIVDDENRVVDVVLWTDLLQTKKNTHSKHLYSNYVVVMAGGKGTRLDPFTRIFPKSLVPVGNKPVIEIIMERFYHSGFYNFIYTLNYRKEYIKIFLKENNFPYKINYVEENNFLGTAGSLALLKDKLDDTFFVTNCDSLLEVDFEAILKWHKDERCAITIIGCCNEVKIPFGVLELNRGKLDKILEKPMHEVIINTGVYVMEPSVISYIPKDKPIDMNHLIEKVAQKNKISVYPIHTGWFDIGQWREYEKSVEKLENYEKL